MQEEPEPVEEESKNDLVVVYLPKKIEGVGDGSAPVAGIERSV